MAIFYLMRHAEQNWDRVVAEQNWPLTAQGRKQAEAVVEQLMKLGIGSVYTSTAERARATVRPFCESARLEAKEDKRLCERILAPVPPPDDEMARHYAASWRDLNYKLPDGESNLEAQERFLRALGKSRLLNLTTVLCSSARTET